jgi:ADP-heptose:LPS heptosyltransferase
MHKSILVIKHSAFGDFVQALGVMRAIRVAHKDAKITLLTTKPFVKLAEASGYFDRVVVDTRPRWYQVFRIMALKRFLNEGKFTRVYDLQNSERTGLYLSLFKRVPEWNGIAFSASHRIADNAARKSVHVFDALRAQVAIAGIAKVTYDDLSWVRSDEALDFRVPKPYVLIAAGSSPQHPQKRWPAEHYIDVCLWLAAQGITPVLLGTADDADANIAIARERPQIYDLTGRTSLFDIPELARGARAALGNDTGPIQMIAPTGCKTLALYPGFSNPKRHGPLGENVVTIQKETMAEITVEEVKDALSKLVAV